MQTLPQDQAAATRNGQGPTPREEATDLVELMAAEMRRLPSGLRNNLLHKLAALVAREIDETRRGRDAPDIGSSISTDPAVELPSDLQGMYYLG